jgi:putative membrane protein
MKRLVLAAAFLAQTSWAAPAPSDSEIVGIVHTANVGEIAAAKLAESKSASADVKAFAKEMVAEHSAMDADGNKFAKKHHMTPGDSDTSKALKSSGDQEMATLKALSGGAFDKAYIEAQVKDHQTVLDTIDNTLIPNAKNADLKAMLEKARPKVAAHLEHAKKLQNSLKAS